MSTPSPTTDDVREAVRERYAKAANAASGGSATCCGPSQSSCGCGGSALTDGESEAFGAELYSSQDRASLPDAAKLASLGCGNPTAVADLHEGEVVLDLGTGGGIDVLLSAQRVGPAGKAYGLDMTDEMLELARGNQRQAGVENVEFLKGTIEADSAAQRVGRRDHLQLRDQPLGRQATGVPRGGAGAAARGPVRGHRHRRRPRDGRGASAATCGSGQAASPAP